MSCADSRALLDELLKLEKLRSADSHQHRRRNQRFIVRGDAELLEMGRGRFTELPVIVVLRDMCRSGVGFVADRSLDIGSVWRLRLLQRGYDIAEVGVIIRYSQKVKDSVYLTGTQVCLRNGLIHLLGVDPTVVSEGDHPTLSSAAAAFLPPSEVS